MAVNVILEETLVMERDDADLFVKEKVLELRLPSCCCLWWRRRRRRRLSMKRDGGTTTSQVICILLFSIELISLFHTWLSIP